MIGTIATGARPTAIGACMNRSRASATTARRRVTGGMNTTKRMNNWSAIAATSGESAHGANMNGGNTTAITTVIATIATATAISARQEFGKEEKSGAPAAASAPLLFCGAK